MKKRILMALSIVGVLMCGALTAFAEGDTSGVVTAITGQVTSLTSDAVTVIGSAVGLGAIFFGAKLLWSKFKSMAK